MRKLIILFLLITSTVIAQKKQDSINKVLLDKTSLELNQSKLKIDSLQKAFERLDSKYDYQVKVNEQTLNSISNQIGAASFNLTIFGILFGIAALGLGIYVTYIERKIIKIREDNEELLAKSLKVKEDVVSINDKIQNDIYSLFLQIKREETVHILKRLEKIPKDVSNLLNELLSRELQKSDFESLKKAYLKLGEDTSYNYKDDYKLLFFQHFLDLSLKDDIISKELKGSFGHSIRCAFENDIIKSTEDFMKVILDLGYQKKEEEINEFIKGLSQSEHKNFNKVYEIIIKALVNRDDQFKFFNLINDSKENRVGKSEYGKLLLKQYNNSQLSESEKLVMEKTNSILKELEQEELERKKAEEARKKQENK